jgi:hypothetical protein
MRYHSCRSTCWILSILLAVSTATAHADDLAGFAPLGFLLGEWTAIGDQGNATGGFTFAPSVQGHVIVRTNYSDTPPANGKPASRHDDLMVIYVEGGTMKADYFDSEGHVIRYVAEARPGTVVFISEIQPGAPRYRLAYTEGTGNTLTGRFEVAPPGKPDAFAPYLSWTARKVQR